MILRVSVAAWVLEEDRRVLAVGDRLCSWLTFVEPDRWPMPAESLQVLEARAAPLPPWPGAQAGRHPTRLDVGGASLYWDAPDRVAGPVEVRGAVDSNNVDAPAGLPECRASVRRVRMAWREFVDEGRGGWVRVGSAARYEDVPASYLPQHDDPADGPATPGSRRFRWTGLLVDLEPDESA